MSARTSAVAESAIRRTSAAPRAPRSDRRRPVPGRTDPRSSAPAVAVLPLSAAVALSLVAGVVYDSAFPDLGFWPVAPVGIALALVSLRGRSFWGAALAGLVFGLSFYLVHIHWATLFLGVVPWLALSVLQALFVAVGAGLIALAYRWVPRVWPTPGGRLVLLPIVVAGIWIAREGVSAVWPYGGFSWGRAAMSQSESPLRELFPWLGMAGVSFVVVLLAASLVSLGVETWAARDRGKVLLPGLVRLAALALIAVALPAWQTVDAGTSRIAGIQGDTNSGYFQQREYEGEILDGHVEATLPVLDDDLDLIVWPEGAADLDPLRSSSAAQIVAALTDRADAPLVLGTITARGSQFFNSSLLWPIGADDPADIYDKRHPVPFGEYVPDRAFWEPFAPDLIGLIGREYTPGTNSPVFDAGGLLVGVNICFDIVDDALMRETALGGAQVVLAQTNNADFGQTDESDQQLAIARIRALELGRSVVNISTVSASAIIGPDGSTRQALTDFEPGALVDDVPLRTGITPAALAGGQIEEGLAGYGLLVLLGAGLIARRRDVG